MGLFSLPTYRVYVVPRLLQMFCVRDAQVRLLLLAHFSSYCSSFTEDQLRTLVLPEASFTMLEFFCYSCYYFIIGIQPLGRFGQRPELSQSTGIALVRCILGKFLGVVCHCFPPRLDVPTFATRCLNDREFLAAEGGTVGENIFR